LAYYINETNNNNTNTNMTDTNTHTRAIIEPILSALMDMDQIDLTIDH